MGHAIEIPDRDPGENGVHHDDSAVGKILAQDDLSKVNWGGIEKLNASAVGPEVVVDQIREHQQSVRGSSRECHIRSAAQPARVVHSIQRTQTKHNQHKDRHDQGQQHGTATRKVAHLLFEYSGDGLRESRKIPAHLRNLNLWRGGSPSSLTETLACELSPNPKME